MALIEWDDRFALGIDSVDHEHREMIGLINETWDHLQREDSFPVLDFLGEINARISAHFALEERIMRERKYDQYREHKAQHELLLDEIRDIMDDYEDREVFETDTVAERLREWFLGHFRTHDARLHRKLG
ncbi:MAG: bacteriohemerythrin [Gammaproteobacteria bacterium]|jgi:hemerythrin-like metal-binding protein|nr:bacteriohemerythrin [Gammaproteobacteria bacterium]